MKISFPVGGRWCLISRLTTTEDVNVGSPYSARDIFRESNLNGTTGHDMIFV